MTLTKDNYTYKGIWRIAYPILISLVMELLIGITDTAYLGHVGELELGASAIAGVYYLIIFMLGFGFSIGVQIIIARRNGEGNYSDIGVVFFHGQYFLLVMAAVVCVVSLVFSPRIIAGIVSSDAIAERAIAYTDWRIFGLFFSFSAAIFRAFYIGTTQTKTLTLNSVVMVLSNVVLNYVFIFGKLGLPAMGIAGAALGSTLSELISLVFFVIYTNRKIDCSKYGLDKMCRFRFVHLRSILKVSAWTTVQNFLSISTWFLFFLLIEHLGERPLAISNIVRSVSSIAFMTVVAFASTCGSLVSNVIGAGKPDLVRPLIRKSIVLAYSLVLPMLAFFCLFPQIIISVYTDIADLKEVAVPSLWVMCSSYLLMVPANVYFQSVSGTGNTKMGFKLELVTLLVYVAFMLFVAVYLRADVAYCWFAELVYASALCALCYIYIRSGKWRRLRI